MIDEIKQINPKYWGKSSWIFLNSLGLIYSPEKKNNYKIFFSKLGDLLPCELCSLHYNTFLPKLDQALESKQTFIDWLLEMRNDINIKSNKPVLSLTEVIGEIYFNTNYNQTNQTNQTNQIEPIKVSFINAIINKVSGKISSLYNLNKKNILLIVIFILIIYFYKKFKKNKRDKDKITNNKYKIY